MIFRCHYTAKRKNAGRSLGRWVRFEIAIIIIMAITYIGLTNDVSTQGYRLISLQDQVKKIEENNAVMEIQVAAEQSLQRLESESGALALEPLGHIEYLTIPAAAVAIR